MKRSFYQLSCSLLVLLLSGCATSDQAAALYAKAEKEAQANNPKLAEATYLACAAYSSESKSQYYQLAAINRLTELEKQLGNATKSRQYMTQAATLAEKLDASSGSAASDKTNALLAKERHLALMRLADSLYEDGNFVSAKKLYEQASSLEAMPQLKNAENAASERIRILDQQAKAENENFDRRLAINRNSKEFRGADAAKRANDRQKLIEKLSSTASAFLESGNEELVPRLLDMLYQLRSEYSYREDAYRRAYKEVASALIARKRFDVLAPLVEEDVRKVSSYTKVDLDAAVPEAVDNATFHTQDLIILSQMMMHQKRYAETLATIQKVEVVAPKVIRPNSPLEVEFLTSLASAYEQNGQRLRALPIRERQMEILNTAVNQPFVYVDALFNYRRDLIEVGRLDEAEKFSEEMIQTVKGLKTKVHTIPAYMSYCDLLMRNKKFEKARPVLLEAIKICQAQNNTAALLNCYVMLSTACSQSSLKEALTYSKHAEGLIRKHGDFGQQQMALIMLNSASYEVQLGKNKDAIGTLDSAIAWQIEHKQTQSACTVALYNLKAIALGNLNDWSGEKIVRSKAIEICRQMNPPQPSVLASTLTQAAGHYQQKAEFAKAEEYFREAIRALDGKTEPEHKQSCLTYKAALGACLAQGRKSSKEARALKDEILNAYKASFTSSQDSNLSLCLGAAELCNLLNDKDNQKLVMQDAETIFRRNKDSLKPFEKRMENQRQSLKAKQA